eukprot:499227-Amorphochlora_amoeboformis.AAC.1
MWGRAAETKKIVAVAAHILRGRVVKEEKGREIEEGEKEQCDAKEGEKAGKRGRAREGEQGRVVREESEREGQEGEEGEGEKWREREKRRKRESEGDLSILFFGLWLRFGDIAEDSGEPLDNYWFHLGLFFGLLLEEFLVKILT